MQLVTDRKFANDGNPYKELKMCSSERFMKFAACLCFFVMRLGRESDSSWQIGSDTRVALCEGLSRGNYAVHVPKKRSAAAATMWFSPACAVFFRME